LLQLLQLLQLFSGDTKTKGRETKIVSRPEVFCSVSYQSNVWMTSPERSFGSNQVVLGGMITLITADLCMFYTLFGSCWCKNTFFYNGSKILIAFFTKKGREAQCLASRVITSRVLVNPTYG
jgi:hypothetical protein